MRCMQIDVQRSEERGTAAYDWLTSRHSFSFGEYYNPEKMGFGTLVVLNEDVIAPGTGFGMHPHENMEIVTLVLEGVVEHRDSIGNKGLIRAGEVQRMSAGTGVVHSEYNASKEKEVHLLQIWVLPKSASVPEYEQAAIPLKRNELTLLVSGKKEKDVVHIKQNAFFLRGIFDAGKKMVYKKVDAANGIYLFVIKGDVRVENDVVRTGDALAVRDVDAINGQVGAESDILIIETPVEV